ncbi:MAG: peroxide stress protein YaaA [Neisseriaceae bacterium]|nr:peroxide stress protein YaaA [Neisseriaceae bacterium]
MLLLLSPAKALNADPVFTAEVTQPDLMNDTQALVTLLRTQSVQDLADLMHISNALAELNWARFQNFNTPFTPQNAKPAAYFFNGDVYEGLDIQTLPAKSVDWLQKHLRILSGLYGVLRPFDLIQAYRLEMGTSLVTPRGRQLYDFWGDKVTDLLNESLQEKKMKTVVNLASAEYFRVVQEKRLAATVITPVFQDFSNDRFKIISFYAKKARGKMARWIAEQEVSDVNELKNYKEEGYQFDEKASTPKKWIFRRNLAVFESETEKIMI